MNHTYLEPTANTTSTAQLSTFIDPSRVSAISLVSTYNPSIYINLPLPSSRTTSPSPSPSPSPGPEMSKHSTAHEEWAGPIPPNALRNSMSLHRPPFLHSSTNYHTTSASGSTSSLPLQQPPSPSTQTTNLTSHVPYRDHPLTTKEEYPNADPASNPYAQVFPPHRTPPRRHGASGHSQHVRQSSFNAWDSLRCRLTEMKCKLCSKEGALGRGLMIGWVLTTVGFLLACAFWKGELFTALDDLSKELYSLGYQGQLIFGFLIFLTTIPPLPLYSTLMVLCGYTFGVWEAFVVSYIASLVGAVTVFIISRTLLRDVITKSLQNSPTAMSLLHIIPSKPHLLLLIRVAPYPYNLLNVILASSPSLTLRTYTACTALSLCKLVLHTWIGAGLHDLSELHGGGPGHGDDGTLSVEDQQRQDVRWYSTCFGVVLCISLFFYLTHLAKRAVAKAQSEHEAREVRCPGQGHLFLREEDA